MIPAAGRLRRFVWMLPLLFLVSAAALADTKEELRNLHAAMSALNQEQQAVFQQFQMLQELRRANDRVLYAGALRTPQSAGEVPGYAEQVQSQRDAARQGELLAQQADALYAQYGEIAAKKALLQERILELTLPK